MNVRDNWRVVLLAVFTVASTVILLGPMVTEATGGQTANATGPTALEYGLELSGGTRVRAPLIGLHAQPVSFPDSYPDRVDRSDLRRSLATELDVDLTDVGVRPRADDGAAVEVYDGNVSREAFRRALVDTGFGGANGDLTVRDGVTRTTQREVVDTLSNKINQGGLTGGSVRVEPASGFVIVEVPNADRSEVLDLIQNRGQVQVVAHFPDERNGNRTYRNVPLLTNEDFASVGTAQPADRFQPYPYVPVSLREEPAQNFSNAIQRFGFTSPEGRENCPTPPNRTVPRNPDTFDGYCLYTVLDGEVVFAASMGDGLANNIESGSFVNSPSYVTTTGSGEDAMGDARQLAIDLRAGALPTGLAIDRGTTYFLEPSLAQEFKLFSLVAGLVAWLAVSAVVFVRYGSPRVAVPMLGTAAAEVFLLLGFAATVGLALDLSHIAGFIAVIGTGVDDLIIIADEILQEGKVATGRVFQNRFRKAFWVIGAAAATTIIAMSPLTVLSLGDLTGFAIVTIVGVLLGVFVTRPAYGDILRNLMLSEEERNREE